MSVPKHHWPEAFLTLCYLINHMPSTSINNKIPFQLFPLFPLLLKTFWMCVFCPYTPSRPDKLSAKSLKCVFLGYSCRKKGYVCYNPTMRKTFITTDVTFFEEVSSYPSSNQVSCHKSNIASSLPTHQVSCPKFVTSSSLPITVLDLPKSTSHSYADPHLVYTRRPREDLISSPPLVPAQRYADPPIVYTRKNNDSSTTTFDQSPPLLPKSGIVPSSSTVSVNNLAATHIPADYNEVMTDPRWKQAMDVEITALNQNHTWHLVQIPAGRKVVGCRWIFTVKLTANGAMD